MQITCVGGGPAGLYFAILMKKFNPEHRVTVLERQRVGVTHGWGVVFWDDLLDDLRTSDAETARLISEEACGWNGTVLSIDGKPAVSRADRGYSIGRQKLLDILHRRATGLGVEVVFEHDVTDAAQLKGADLIVASDGSGSSLRNAREAEFRPHIETRPNKYIWLGTTKIFDHFTFGFVPTPSGWVWYHAYQFDNAMSTFIVECSPETWLGLGFDRTDNETALSRLGEIFKDHLGGHGLLLPQAEGRSSPWRSFRTITNETWHRDNVVLVGDAAHTTHFTIGAGTRLAMQDAISLAGHINNGPGLQAAFTRYEAERKTALWMAQRDAGLSAQWFENVPRYIGFASPVVYELMAARSSRVMHRIPPMLFYRMQYAIRHVGLLRALRRQVRGAGLRLSRLSYRLLYSLRHVSARLPRTPG